jgi:phosphoserine aminotransferase
MTTTDVTATRTPAEGDVTYHDGRVQVYHGNAWTDANDDVKMDNDVVIYRNGRATRHGVEVEWEDGYVVDREGNVWDRTGNAISDAWDATKHGVKKAGKAVGHAAEKVGEKAKDAVD